MILKLFSSVSVCTHKHRQTHPHWWNSLSDWSCHAIFSESLDHSGSLEGNISQKKPWLSKVYWEDQVAISSWHHRVVTFLFHQMEATLEMMKLEKYNCFFGEKCCKQLKCNVHNILQDIKENTSSCVCWQSSTIYGSKWETSRSL